MVLWKNSILKRSIFEIFTIWQHQSTSIRIHLNGHNINIIRGLNDNKFLEITLYKKYTHVQLYILSKIERWYICLYAFLTISSTALTTGLRFTTLELKQNLHTEYQKNSLEFWLSKSFNCLLWYLTLLVHFHLK